MSLTPLNCALNALILALNDSANAFVSLFTKYLVLYHNSSAWYWLQF